MRVVWPYFFWLAFALVMTIIGLVIGPGKAASQSPTTFLETWDGNPASPLPWRPANWDVSLVAQEPFGTQTGPFDAHHGPGCEAPTQNPMIPFNAQSNPLVTHPVSTNSGTTFTCNGHLMFGIRGDSYAAIYMNPNQMVDFSQSEAVVRFDMSTLRTSSRDWWDLVITPFNDNVQTSYQSEVMVPRNALRIEMQGELDRNRFVGMVARDFQQSSVAFQDISYNDWLSVDPSRRDTFELRISRDRLSFCMPDYNRCWASNSAINPPLSWDVGVVQLNQRSYNPFKDEVPGCATIMGGHCRPDTWHVDNFQISPAREFSLINADQTYLFSNQPEATFPHPAPANAMLRFIARSDNQVQVSFNGGPWQNATYQASSGGLGTEWYRPYWMPVPVGTDRVRFRRADIGTQWQVRHPAFWSLGQGGEPSTPIPTFSATPVSPTETPMPTMIPSVTPGPSPSSTPTAVPPPTDIPITPTSTFPTPTPEPTLTPLPTSTPEPCYPAYFQGDELVPSVRGPATVCP